MNEAEPSTDKVELENGFVYYLRQKWKLFVTLFCLFSFVTMSVHLELSGSTMVMLSVQVGTDMAQISWIVAARSFGYMITIVLFGVLFRSIIKHHSASVVAVGYLFPAIATICTPYLKSWWALCIALLFQGMLQGVSDLAVNTLLITMWSIRSTAPLNCVYLGYPLGALLSIVLVWSFGNEPVYPSSTITVRKPQFQPQLVGPYVIASILCLISATGFAFIAYKEYRRRKKTRTPKLRTQQSVAKEELHIEAKPKRLLNKAIFWKTCSPTTCGQGYIAYGFLLISLIMLYNFFFGGVEQGLSKFFYAFIQQQKVGSNKNDALYTMAIFWVSMLVGRIVCTFLTAVWISPHLMLAISWVLCLLTYLLWLLFIWYVGLTRLSIFVFISASGLNISSISPTTIGWIKQYLSLSPVELALIFSANGFGGIVFGLICGNVFQYYGSRHLFSVLTGAVLVCCALFLLTLMYERVHRRWVQKHANEQKEHEIKRLESSEDRTLEKFLQHEEEQEPLSLNDSEKH